MATENNTNSLDETSVPQLLKQMQNEWDSAMLQISQLKKQLEEAQQELATALYLNDGAKRVIAKLIQERDAAKAELAALQSSQSSSSSSSSSSSFTSSEEQ